MYSSLFCTDSMTNRDRFEYDTCINTGRLRDDHYSLQDNVFGWRWWAS